MPAEDISRQDEDTRKAAIEKTTYNSLSNKEAELTAAQTLFKNAIKVVAIGGGGGNALNHIISHGIEGVDMLAVNTDIRSLDMSLCDSKIVLGERVTKGLGAGARPEIGEKAAQESISDIRQYLQGADMVYLAAGMGGGTGTGAIPIIARTAREMGILTVAVVTKPFSFEGKRRKRYAEEGIERLFPEVDALIVVPNDRLLEISNKDTPITESFSLADEILRQAVQGVTDLVTRPGLVNVDFADLKTIMRGAGRSVMGIGVGNGENNVINAVKNALESPLMECSMHGAKGVLMNITYRNGLGVLELSSAADVIEDVIAPEANFIWGCVEDPTLENEVEITIVAAGFDEIAACVEKPVPAAEAEPARQRQSQPSYVTRRPEPKAAENVQPAQPLQTAAPAETEPRSERVKLTREVHTPAWLLAEDDSVEQRAEENKKPRSKQIGSSFDIYEKPTFLRRGRKLNTQR